MREKYMAGLEKSRMATSQSPNKNERKNSLGGVFSTMQISPDFFTKIWKYHAKYKSGEFQGFIFFSKVINIVMMITKVDIDYQKITNISYQH